MACAEKFPFYAFSVESSVITIMAQKSGSAVWEAVPFPIRVAIASDSLISYLWKMIVPLNLLPFYPYPLNATVFSLRYIAALAFVVAITMTCLMIAKRQRLWLAVWWYYVLSLIPVLGIVQVGGQAMADRHAYLPSIGPFLLSGIGVAWASTRMEKPGYKLVVIKRIGLACVVAIFVFLSYLTLKQIKIWQNDLALWTHVIDRESTKAILAYLNRGNAFARMGRYAEAIEDFSTVIKWNYQEDSKLYINRGLAYYQLGQVELALNDLNRACELGDDFGCKAIQFFIVSSTKPAK
jgi:tetratricopeptide (TPR) repeat protein